ncbi:NACHT domain-containing protein [Nostoc sp. CHAB 5824]|nr:NACHT domain-containing protein [Nostoc sp. CHAB 5824]
MNNLRSLFGNLLNFKQLADKIGIVVFGGSVTIGNLHVTETGKQKLTDEQGKNRQALLEKVKTNWIEGILKKSLIGGLESIELTINEQLDKVNPPNRNSGSGLALRVQSQAPQSHQGVIGIFDKLGEGRSLLILGEPGSGKTNTLLELARELRERAEEDKSQRIPLVFNLSSWKEKQEIDKWLVKELKTQYQTPEKSANYLINKPELILLLLDGLDEVEEKDLCIDALNTFIKDRNIEIVVSCRGKEYDETSKKLNFQSAVYLEPLTLKRVYKELDKIGDSLQKLKNEIGKYQDLQELATTPLYLQLMIFIYKNQDKFSATQLQKKLIFQTYSDLIFNDWKNGSCYSKDKAKGWLIWLAKQMQQESGIFAIENMQPKLLLSSKAHHSAYVLIVSLIVGLLCGLSCGLLSGVLNYDSRTNLHIYHNPIISLCVGMISGLLSGLVSGLIFLLCEQIYDNVHVLINLLIGVISFVIRLLLNYCVPEDKIQLLDPFVFGLLTSIIFYRINYQNINSVDAIKWSPLQAKESFRRGMLWAFFSGISVLMVGILWVFFSNLQLVQEIPWINNLLQIAIIPLTKPPKTPILDNAALWCILALIIIFGINIWLILGTERTVKITPNLLFIRNNRNYLVICILICGGMISLIFMLLFAQNREYVLLVYNTSRQLNKLLWGLLSLQLFVGLIVGIALGFGKDANVGNFAKPNYGIIRTFRNAGKLSIFCFLFSGIISFIFWWIYHKNSDYIWWIFYGKSIYNGVWFGLTVGLMVGLLSGMVNGENSGLVCIKHFILRVMLWQNKNIPWKLARLLNCATKRGLLRQVGGNYRFIHPLLQKYLSDISS